MHQKNFFMYAPMYTTKFVGSFPIHWVVADVSISFRNLQISLKSSNWYKQIKNKPFYFMYNVATMVGSACSGSCNRSLT